MKISDMISFKEFVHYEIKQAKPFHKRIKRLTLYKDNKPIKWNRYTNQ